MPHGPVNTTTYEFLKGEVHPDQAAGWREFLLDRSDHRIGLENENIDPDDLDELSDADIAVLDAVWDQFGGVNQWQLRDWTRDPHNVPEWGRPERVVAADSSTAHDGCCRHRECH